MSGKSLDRAQKERSLAERIFDGGEAESELSVQLYEAGVPFENIGWDWYDCSLELRGIPPEYRLPEEVQRIVHKAGFGTCYVNHKDKWETHYHFDPRGEFAISTGWRVSYPHKRNDGSKDIWVESQVPSWPSEWFSSGYAKVKEWLRP